MKFVLAASCLVLLPGLVRAEPRCGVPVSPAAEAALPNAPQGIPVVVAQATVPAAAVTLPTPRTSTAPAADAPALPPSLQHIAAAGAAISEMGDYHGLRRAIARTGDQFMLLSATPDGQAVVAGLMSDLSAAELAQLAGGGLTELGMLHGLRGLMVRSGTQFQVFYATPDGARVIPGVMWDAAGRNLTREQIAPIAGAVPTVTIGPICERRRPGVRAQQHRAIAGRVSPEHCADHHLRHDRQSRGTSALDVH
jgi:thiol:disulfide interchange protein DsbG